MTDEDPEQEGDLTWAQVEALSPSHRSIAEARAAWIETARPKQLPPPGLWFIWGLISGRFFGKTEVGSQECWYDAARTSKTRIGVVAPTQSDLRRTIFEGVSGILARVPVQALRGGSLRAAYNRGFHELYFADGSVILGYSAEQPSRVRGANLHMAWCDELAAWPKSTVQDTWDNLMFAVRLPSKRGPRVIVTTTPKPIPLIRKIIRDPRAIIITGSSYENAANIGAAALETVSKYEGTSFGRQEIHGEVLDEEEGAIFQRQWFRLWPHDRMFPAFNFILLSIDGAYTEKEVNDPSACSAWGVFRLTRQTQRGVWLPSKPGVMLLDRWAERLRFGRLVDKVRDAHRQKYGGESKRLPDGRVIHGLPGRSPDLILVEDKASGLSLIQSLEDEGLPVEAFSKGKMDKAMMAHTVSDIPCRGQVWIPESSAKPGSAATWAEPLLAQACAFTGEESSLPVDEAGKHHDDDLDTMTQALSFLRDNGYLAPFPVDGGTEAASDDAKDERLWPKEEEGDIGYGVRKRGSYGGEMRRNPYDG